MQLFKPVLAIVTLVILFECAVGVEAYARQQEKTDAAKTAEVKKDVAKPSPDIIEIDAKKALRVRDAQIVSFALQQQQQQAQRELNDAINDIYTSYKVSQQDYNINDKNWRLEKIKKEPPPVKK